MIKAAVLPCSEAPGPFQRSIIRYLSLLCLTIFDNHYLGRSRPPVPTPRNEKNDSPAIIPDDHTYEEVNRYHSSQDNNHSNAGFAFESSQSSQSEFERAYEYDETLYEDIPANNNSQSSRREFSSKCELYENEDYVDCNQTRTDLQYSCGYDYPRIISDGMVFLMYCMMSLHLSI